MAEEIRLPEEDKLPNIYITNEEFETYMKSLDELTLLEASTLKRSVDETIQQWKLCKQALDKLGSESVDEKLNNTIVEANILKSIDLDTKEDFIQDYGRNISRLDRIAEKLLAIIEEHKDEVDSTKYMTEQMITILNRRLGALNKEDPNYEYELKAGTTIRKTFEYRLKGSQDIIKHLATKMVSYVNTHRKEISKSIREETRLITSGVKTRAIKDLCHQFSENTIAKFMYYLRENMNDSAELVIIFTNFLAHLLKYGKSKGEDSYIKILILDFVDIYNGIYDIPNYNPSEYMEFFYENITEVLGGLVESFKWIKKWCIISDLSDCGLTTPLDEPAEMKGNNNLEDFESE